VRYPRLAGAFLLLIAAAGFWALLYEAHMLATERPNDYRISEIPQFALAFPLVAGTVLSIFGAGGVAMLKFNLRRVTWQQTVVVVTYFAAVVAIHHWRNGGIAALGYKFFFAQ
jgi:hypothetical protein